MVRIAISPAAFDAICATLLGRQRAGCSRLVIIDIFPMTAKLATTGPRTDG